MAKARSTFTSSSRGTASAPLPRSPTLIGLEVLLGAGALGGAVGLLATGAGMDPALLESTPFTTWTWPAVALVMLVGVPLLAAARGEWHRRPWAAVASLWAGLVLMGWIAVQVAVIGYQMWLQPVCFVVGLVIVVRASPRAARQR